MRINSLMNLNIPKEVEYVIENLRDSGYKAYLVGGCVRDFVMGTEPKDFDITTNAKPEEVHDVFEGEGGGKDAHLIDTGIKQGTVTVIKNHVPVEVTTHRKEIGYSDSRHPDSVVFSESLVDDLARRDFTMNAIAYDFGEFVDPFNGLVDIDNRLIRAVGKPEDRFREDALRIMRALRFSSVLGFEIEEGTKEALIEEKERLNLISRERIQKELELLLCGKDVERVLRDYADVIAIIIPEIVPMFGLDQCTPYHIYDVWEHTLKVIANTPPVPVLRLTGLFHDIGKPATFVKSEDGIGHFFGHPEVSCEMADKIMRRLKFDNATRNDVLTLVRWHDLRPEPTDKSLRKVIMRVTPGLFDEWIHIKRADNKGQSPDFTESQEFITELREIGRRLIESEGELSLKTLDITGEDLKELGLAEGPIIGQVLNELILEVLEEIIPNEKAALMEAAKTVISKL